MIPGVAETVQKASEYDTTARRLWKTLGIEHFQKNECHPKEVNK